MRALYLMRVFLTQVGNFGNDSETSEDLLGGQPQDRMVAAGQLSGVFHTPARQTRPSTHPDPSPYRTPPLAPSQPPNWYPFSPPPTPVKGNRIREAVKWAAV